MISDCPPPPAPASSHAGMIMWAVIFAAVLVYEIVATATHHQTLTQTVRHGPRWFRIALGTGLAVLVVHLFLLK